MWGYIMKHIIKMLHRLTDDQKGVYFSCEENGRPILVSGVKPNGMFHLIRKNGIIMDTDRIDLYNVKTKSLLMRFNPNSKENIYSGVFTDKNNTVHGNISDVGSGSDRYYVANICGNTFECYKWSVGTNASMSFYKNGILKAMLIEDKLSVNSMFSMTIHIIDDENIAELCMLGLVYHEFENIYDMASTFRRQFIRKGNYISFNQHVANYHMEVYYKGIGKSKCNPQFLRQFYSEKTFPYDDSPVDAGDIIKETGVALKTVTSTAWTDKNLKDMLKSPIAIILLLGVPVICGIIGGFAFPSMLANIGLNLYSYSAGIRFLCGFMAMFIFTGLGEGLFILFFKLLTIIVKDK